MRSLRQTLPRAETCSRAVGDATYAAISIPVRQWVEEYSADDSGEEDDRYDERKFYCIALRAVFKKCNQVVASTDGSYIFLSGATGDIRTTSQVPENREELVLTPGSPVTIDLTKGEYVLIFSDEYESDTACTIYPVDDSANSRYPLKLRILMCLIFLTFVAILVACLMRHLETPNIVLDTVYSVISYVERHLFSLTKKK